MNKIDEINEQIEKLEASKRRIQEECDHPSECVMKMDRGPVWRFSDRILQLHCTKCDKIWNESRREWEAKERERKLTKKSPAES